MNDAKELITRYFDAFNAGDAPAMCGLVSEDLEHHVNQGETRRGRAAFAEFLDGMDVAYQERATDLLIFISDDGLRAAAEFTIHGRYLKTQEGLPDARGQSYVLPVGSFFTLRDGEICRVSTYYNLADWITQVSA